MNKLQRNSLPKGGFAGVREHRLIKSPKAFGPDSNNDGSWPGIGNFVYMADARFIPNGETKMHNHHEVDVISVVVDGRISHEGSLGHGQDLVANDVQVQRAGGEGFSHNEINPESEWNRMIQLWVLPEVYGQPADYKVYRPLADKLTRVYGGGNAAETSFVSHTVVDVALLEDGQQVQVDRPSLTYITKGAGELNGETVSEGDLISSDQLHFTASENTQFIVVHTIEII